MGSSTRTATFAFLAVLLLLVWAPGTATAVDTDTGGMRGRVTAHDGAPVAGAVVSVVAPPERPCVPGAECPARAEAVTGEDGVWHVGRLVPGDYTVHVRDPDGRHGDRWFPGRVDRGDPVRVEPAAETAGVDVVLHPAGTVTGRLRAETGAPVPGIRVRIERTPFHVLETLSGADGTFTLGGAPGGDHLVEARPGGSRYGRASATVAVADGGLAEVILTLPPGTVAVERVAGVDRVQTAVAASQRAFPSAQRVVLASAGTFADALAAAPLAARLQGPLLLTGTRLAPAVRAEIARLGAREVVVVGAFGAVPTVIDLALEADGLAVRRVAGENRFDTAALIAREVGAPHGEAIIASGSVFPDALAVAPLAASRGIPIILVERHRIPPDAAEALAALGITRTMVVGGVAAVSEAVAAALPSPTRVAGPERYATALAVAETSTARGIPVTTVGVATGRDFPDALAAGPAVAALGGLLLLVDGRNADGADATYAFLERHLDRVERVVVFGGRVAVVDGVVERLRRPGAPR